MTLIMWSSTTTILMVSLIFHDSWLHRSLMTSLVNPRVLMKLQLQWYSGILTDLFFCISASQNNGLVLLAIYE